MSHFCFYESRSTSDRRSTQPRQGVKWNNNLDKPGVADQWIATTWSCNKTMNWNNSGRPKNIYGIPSGHHQPNKLQQIKLETLLIKVHPVDGLVGLDYTNYLRDSEHLTSVSCMYFCFYKSWSTFGLRFTQPRRNYHCNVSPSFLISLG